MPYRSNEPFNDLPLLPPAAFIETTRVLAGEQRGREVLYRHPALLAILDA
jgi:hypothetical protein